MAARTQTQTAMLRAGASDSEDDLATASANSTRHTLSTGSERGKRLTMLGTRKASKAKSAMTKPNATKPAPKRKAAPKTARQPLKDRTNVGSDGEEEEEETEKPKAKRAKTTTAARKPKAVKQTLGVSAFSGLGREMRWHRGSDLRKHFPAVP